MSGKTHVVASGETMIGIAKRHGVTLKALLAANPALKAEFEAKLATDPKFARNPDARLGWFYERTPYYDERFLLYPVGREPKR